MKELEPSCDENFDEIFELQTVNKEKSIDIIFRKMIDETTFKKGVLDYANLSIDGLTLDFVIDFPKFRELICKNKHFEHGKFYYLDDNGKLNLGLSLSNFDSKKNESSDELFELQDGEFVYNDFTEKYNAFKKVDGMKEKIKLAIPGREVVEMIRYDVSVIRAYNFIVNHSFKVDYLKLKMFKFPSNYIEDNSKSNAIAFAVNPLIDGLNESKVKHFDAGDLKP